MKSVPVVLVAAVLLGACLDGEPRQKRPAGSAIWIEGGELGSSELNRLETADLGEIWFDAARIVQAGEDFELRPGTEPGLPAQTRVTLVVRGRWPGEQEIEALAQELQRLVITHESRGRIPVGLHLIVETSDLEAFAEDLLDLRGELGRSAILLSTSFDRDELEEEASRQVADAVDFVVCDLYGQRPGLADDTRYWDLLEVERDVRRLEEMAVPYLVGVNMVGSVAWLGEGTSVREYNTDSALMELVSDRRTELEHGFTLEGIDRQVYGLRILEARKLGDWELRPGDRLRMTRLASHHLVELRRRLAGWELSHHHGELYYRLAQPGETLTPTVQQLEGAFSGRSSEPELTVVMQEINSTRGRRVLRLTLENLNGESTDLATIDSNFLEVRITGGYFKAVAQGGFFRYDLLKESSGGQLYRTLSEPDVLRLYHPLIDGFARIVSGPVEIGGGGEPSITIEGRFLLPDTRIIDLGPIAWP